MLCPLKSLSIGQWDKILYLISSRFYENYVTHIKLSDLSFSRFPSSWSEALQGEGGHWEQWREIHLGISSYWDLNLIPHSQSENRKQPFLNQPSFVTSTFSYMEESLLGICKSHFQLFMHNLCPSQPLFSFGSFLPPVLNHLYQHE